MARASLARRVTLFSTLGLGAIWSVAVLLMSVILWTELDEMFDQELVEYGQVLLPLLSANELAGGRAADVALSRPSLSLEEAVLYRLFDGDGRVLQQAAQTDAAALPDPRGLPVDRITGADDYQVYVTAFNQTGHALQIAAPMAERREAFRDGMMGFLLPMIALLPLTWLLIGWITRRALAPMRALGDEIAARDGDRLDPIDASDWPEDLVRIAGTTNGFIARLSQALDAERAFASNAAHELRTPVAIALTQVQQLREIATTDRQIARTEALERALQRMRRLVARLLQLARADAGIGGSEIAHDLVPLTRLILDDAMPHGRAGRIRAELPDAAVPARIDPDAYAIVLGNLVENALQHGPADAPVLVRLRPDAVIEVSNGGPALPDAAQGALTRRFGRRHGEGFGLGLDICTQILTSAGGRLELLSPRPDQTDGFLARVRLQQDLDQILGPENTA
ncbi:ATP-binding protein [uncultured Paracoccus sp.]|uniref:sensor histidine kinase n=1 Tax=uncultured Paracoccus sp. TaxID=189685 RepID=UPI00261E886E|nr:ATP-binding protein [uncultured Paracoccus sp.]